MFVSSILYNPLIASIQWQVQAKGSSPPSIIPPTTKCSNLSASEKFPSLSHHLKLQPLEAESTATAKRTTNLHVETRHGNENLRALIRNINRKDFNPLKLLRDQGDWTQDELWAVMKLLKETSRMQEAIQVFNFWRSMKRPRNDCEDYTMVIDFLSKSGLTEEAITMLHKMKTDGLDPPAVAYNSIIHGFAEKRDFENAQHFLKEMEEVGAIPGPETYNGLIQAYGSYRMYDEMCKCTKMMEAAGFDPNHFTYNILIRAFAQGGLLEKMEGLHRKLISKKMGIQSSTLVAMLEAYANFGILQKMEKVYWKILKSDIYLNQALVRKMATIYIDNHMFSRLEELGMNTAKKTGKTSLVWCLLLLSGACLLSHRGMETVIREMKIAKVRHHITFINIIALAYLKMKDFRHLDFLLCRLQAWNVKPDLITFGVAFDAHSSGSVRMNALDEWKRKGFLKKEVQMNTDPLVLTAFGKGSFVTSCEGVYSSLGSKERKKLWTYYDLIDLVLKNGKIASCNI